MAEIAAFFLPWWLFLVSSYGIAAPKNPPIQQHVMPSDIAMVLPAQGSLAILPREPFFSSPWFHTIDKVFRNTAIEDSFLTESPISDWRLVSIRLAPCQPLLPFISTQNQTLCELELRLVWQPIEQRRHVGEAEYYADDRAIHSLYDVDPTPFIGPTDAVTYSALKARATQLTPDEVDHYRRLHQRFVASLIHEVLQLRGLSQDDAYQWITERPEFQTHRGGQTFIRRLKNFLSQHARFDRLKELTAFSLPAGRQPPLLDEWIFLAFEPRAEGTQIASKDITLNSRQDGRVLFNYGHSMSGTMRFDDQRLHAALSKMPKEDIQEIEKAVILKPRAPTSLKESIADRLTTHVSHTSCASCHKLKATPFDFHNLSYFEDRPIEPSPRVDQDVARDLEWLHSL